MRLTWRFKMLLTWMVASLASNFAIADDASADVRKAIESATSKFVDAFNANDTKAMSEIWTATGDFVGENGHKIRFREQLEAREQQKQAASKEEQKAAGPSLEMTVDSVRLVVPQVATVDGTDIFRSSAKAPPIYGRYTATWVFDEAKGTWRLDSVRENHVPAGLHHAHLTDLDWLIGDWASKGEGPSFETSVRWSKDGNYIEREFTSSVPGRGKQSGTNRIGWDPKREQFRSWTFGHDGSFSHGLWEPAENGWSMELSGVTADGKATGSLGRVIKIDDDTIEWESLENTLEGHPMPGLKLRLHRKSVQPREKR